MCTEHLSVEINLGISYGTGKSSEIHFKWMRLELVLLLSYIYGDLWTWELRYFFFSFLDYGASNYGKIKTKTQLTLIPRHKLC